MERKFELLLTARCAIPNLMWPHMHKILASSASVLEVISLAATWCAPQEKDELTKYLAHRCSTLQNLSMDEFLRLGVDYPHIFGKLRCAGVFERLHEDVKWLQHTFPDRLQAALPSTGYCHTGSYRPYNRLTLEGGWSCCRRHRKKDPGCQRTPEKGRDIAQGMPANGLLLKALRPCLRDAVQRYTEELQGHF
eukprot:TRINITY_DN18896_c0_g1_i1.p1 TRINITY_DN18896_c0_g1~~TRINITY_DN18896_c0_g1_i1.p1  ORF type:complete len:193 (+),score=24.24 TRINITY_DN18896_c0_g1_i1:259-837(+)